MAGKNLAKRIKTGIPFILDGAMGTQLMAHNVGAGKCNAYLNIESPEIIGKVHSAYIAAGSDAVITNTFGANEFALARYGYSEMVTEINQAAATLARQAAGEEKYVFGNIGPSGDFLEPLGSLSPDRLRAAFCSQAKALAEGGVDGFIIETMTAVDEAAAALEAIKSVSDLPAFVSFAFDPAGENFKTMMGTDIDAIVAKIMPLKPDAIGFNCGSLSMAQYVKLAEKFASLCGDVALLAEPNAGTPKLSDGRAVYDLSAADFAATTADIHSLGFKIIGGCCGTGPAHIEAVSKKITK